MNGNISEHEDASGHPLFSLAAVLIQKCQRSRRTKKI